jgi:hypothetical protein
LSAEGRLDNFELVSQVSSQLCREDAAMFVYRRK